LTQDTNQPATPEEQPAPVAEQDQPTAADASAEPMNGAAASEAGTTKQQTDPGEAAPAADASVQTESEPEAADRAVADRKSVV